MTVAERIGLPSFLGWLVEHPTLTFFYALMITPGMVWLMAVVFESRVVGKHFRVIKDAFAAFMPGEVYLALCLYFFTLACGDLPDSRSWYSNRWYHISVFTAWVVVGLLLREFKEKRMLGYTKSQLWSPSKVYHDFVLYMGYGYLLTVVATAALFGADYGVNTQTFHVCFGVAAFALWVWGMLCDGRTYTHNRAEFNRLVSMAHGRWNPIWRSKK